MRDENTFYHKGKTYVAVAEPTIQLSSHMGHPCEGCDGFKGVGATHSSDCKFIPGCSISCSSMSRRDGRNVIWKCVSKLSKDTTKAFGDILDNIT